MPVRRTVSRDDLMVVTLAEAAARTGRFDSPAEAAAALGVGMDATVDLAGWVGGPVDVLPDDGLEILD